MNKKIIMRLTILVIGCICMIIAAIAMFIGGNKKQINDKKTERLEIPNPLTEVKSVSEMNQYLGYTVPVMDKKVEKYIIIGEGKYATHARIIYEDNTEFDMEKGSRDVSGIYGGEKQNEKEWNKVKIIYYQKDKTNYITYQTKEYSYSYSKEDKEVTQDEVKELIQISK